LKAGERRGSSAPAKGTHPEDDDTTPRLCHSELRRGIWPRTGSAPGLWPDLSTALRFAQGDKKASLQNRPTLLSDLPTPPHRSFLAFSLSTRLLRPMEGLATSTYTLDEISRKRAVDRY